MKRAGQMLPKAVGRDEVLRTARAQQVLRFWPEIVGEGLASRSHPDRYGKGTVWVAVTGSAWAQELRMRKDLILERLRERAGDPSLFLDVRFGVRPLPSPDLEPSSNPPEAVVESKSESDEPPAAYLSIREIAERRLRKMREQKEP